MAAVGGVLAATACVAQGQRASFEILRKRMDVDVDGAPTAYGPPGMRTLDRLKNAHTMGDMDAPIVGFILEHGKPVVQGPDDPAPGYYVSQTAFEDDSLPEHDPRRYVDATKISYVVLGDEARRRGARVGGLCGRALEPYGEECVCDCGRYGESERG